MCKNLCKPISSFICILNRLQKYILIFPSRESDDELFPENQVEEIATTSTLDKRSRTEEELSEDADAISFVHKRSKIIATQCEIVQTGNDTELTEKDNSTDMDKSQTDGKSNKKIEEEEETENALQEQDKTQNEKQSQIDIDVIPNVTTESKKECKLASLNTEKQKQHEQPEDFVSCTDKGDKRIEKSPKKVSEKVAQKSEDDPNVCMFDDDVIESLDMFNDEVNHEVKPDN